MRLATAIALFCGGLFGQPAFDAASVHPSTATSSKGPVFSGGRFEMRRATMPQLIAFAYNINQNDISGGPNWLDFDKFDLVAKAPADTKIEDGRLMLQSLLAGRFKLAVHKADVPHPEFALVMGKGKLQLKQSDGSGQPGCRSNTIAGSVTVESSCRNLTMAVLAARLTGQGSGYLDASVVDATGLTGAWDADFRVTPSSARAAEADGVSIFEAVEKLGLKLERREVPLASIVVDRVNQAPLPNPPGVEQALALPVPATEFEVASVKPLAANSNGPAVPSSPAAGRLSQRGTLSDLIAFAWDIRSDAIAGAPKFVNMDRFEVIAEAPASVPHPVDIDVFRLMARTLLKSRFGLAVHEEIQPVDTYVLTVPKAEVKMIPAPDQRGECKSTPEKIPPGSGLSSAITCRNTTMAQLAERLPGMAPNYINSHRVIDETGLAGTWNFLVLWTGLAQINGRVNALAPGDREDALSQSGSTTLFESLEKLGLKLTLQKRPTPVLVMDHVEQKPSEN
jgi:uncharacterized protein (TIGR03435 family)